MATSRDDCGACQDGWSRLHDHACELGENGARWVVVARDDRERPWAVRDRAGELGDLPVRTLANARSHASKRNRRYPWPE